MITMTFPFRDERMAVSSVECQDCGHITEACEAFDIENPHKVLYVGDEIPAGQCPLCEHGLMYLTAESDD
jgi:hypothetical protein